MRTVDDYCFRIWDEEEQCFNKITFHSFGTLIDWDSSQKRTKNANGEIDVKGVDLTGKTIEQCTMVKDIRGVWIWEGDIVREIYVQFEDENVFNGPLKETPGEAGIVTYVTGEKTTASAMYIVLFSNKATTHLSIAHWTDGRHRRWEVLGNIHQNPDLVSSV